MGDAIKILKNTKTHVMTGVSYMIPFAVLGGVTLAVCVLLGGQNAVPTEGVIGQIATIGSAGLGLMVPILSGFTAYSIADRSGLAPGIVSGYLANAIGAGFLGGIVTGLLTGIVVHYLKKIKLPENISSVMSIFIIPLVGGIVVCSILLFIIGQPIAFVMTSLTNWLNDISSGNIVVLALVMGAMCCTDMGGPINKVAYTFGVTMVGTLDATTGMPSESAMLVMGAVGAACAIPSLACGLSTLLFANRYTKEERDTGIAALVMGCVGISEGAIPFAAKAPLRTLPGLMLGGALGAAVSVAMGAMNPAPWGGFIVAPVITNPLGYIVGTLVGMVVGGVVMGLMRKPVTEQAVQAASTDDDVDDFDLEIELG